MGKRDRYSKKARERKRLLCLSSMSIKLFPIEQRIRKRENKRRTVRKSERQTGREVVCQVVSCLTVRSSRYIVFDRKSIPIVA